MGRRCEKGKPCGATCIERKDKCWVDAPRSLNDPLSLTRVRIQGRKSAPYSLSPSVKGGSYGPSTGAQVTAKGILNGLQQETSTNRQNGIVKEKDVNWRAVLSSGVSYVGGGDYGSFVTLRSESLLDKEKDGVPKTVGVKAGRIGENEIAALRIVGANDLGPRLLASRISKIAEKDKGGNNTYSGVIAMTKVPAMSYKRAPETWGIYGSKSDIYWKAMAELHRLGIAHNDMHGGNVMLDSKGKGRFVDFGLAQISRKAALAEALGSLNWENWQFSASQTEGLARIAKANLARVERILESKGFSPMDIEGIKESGIRNKDDFYKRGAWGKLTENDAKQLIDAFYKGI